MLFIGQPHPIAVQSMRWLIRETLPLIPGMLSEAGLPVYHRRFTLAGRRWDVRLLNGMKEEGRFYDSLQFAGEPTNEEILDAYSTHRVFIGWFVHVHTNTPA